MPTGFKAEVPERRLGDSARVKGKQVTFSQSQNQLIIRGRGKKFEIGRPIDLMQAHREWKEGVRIAQRSGNVADLVQVTNRMVKSTGTVGKLMSISDGFYVETARGISRERNVSTWDATTGKRVMLDQLLSPKQMTSLVNDIEKALPGIGGEAFTNGDRQDLYARVNENFSLRTNPNGQATLHVAWEDDTHQLGSGMVHFTANAPADAAFLRKAGIE
jgi:hypothetical protein